MTSYYERHDLSLWKTRKAAENNARIRNAEFSQLGLTWTATQKTNGYWTLTKREGNKC
jgi:hypothetical protein